MNTPAHKVDQVLCGIQVNDPPQLCESADPINAWPTIDVSSPPLARKSRRKNQDIAVSDDIAQDNGPFRILNVLEHFETYPKCIISHPRFDVDAFGLREIDAMDDAVWDDGIVDSIL